MNEPSIFGTATTLYQTFRFEPIDETDNRTSAEMDLLADVRGADGSILYDTHQGEQLGHS